MYHKENHSASQNIEQLAPMLGVREKRLGNILPPRTPRTAASFSLFHDECKTFSQELMNLPLLAMSIQIWLKQFRRAVGGRDF